MKILYVATSFPTPEKGNTIYTDLAEALCESGHEIIVIVSEDPKNIKQTEKKLERGFEVLRIITGSYYNVNLLKKGITSILMPFKLKNGISKFLKNRNFDLILYESPPVTNANLITWLKGKFKATTYLMLKDIFPQNAVDLGIIKKQSLIYKYFKMQEKKLYSISDYIGCMSKANLEYIKERNPEIDSKKLEIFPNTKRIKESFDINKEFVRNKYGLPLNSTIFLFGGNMGKPQYIELLRDTIIHFKDRHQMFFLFIGRGTERDLIVNAIKDYNILNAKIIENIPRDEFDQITKVCDVGLITLSNKFTIPNYPSRILSYLEFSKPVIAATDTHSDLKELIYDSKCGEWVNSEDKDMFYSTILSFSKRNDLTKLGNNGYDYLVSNLTVEKSVHILEEHFK